ncbi:ISL3 family transposase [Effusibacillus consociatus]|uniref:ISL3 family transposase n=2 Tax=Effusibacillus consociatus TaxID=1117041 RepID=A0ABV9Q2C4_9BACL
MRKVPYRIMRQEEIPFGYPNAGLHRDLALLTDGGHCPNCGAWCTYVHERCPRVVISGSFNGTPVYDSFVHRRFTCDNCHRTFMERLSWLEPYQQLTESGKTALLYTAADSTFKATGVDFGRSGQNVKVHVRRHYNSLQTDDFNNRTTPAYMGIDEISLAKGKGSYRLVVYDLTVPWRPQLMRIHDSRKKDEVAALLRQFKHPEQIIAIAIDMWEPYKTAIETALPHVLVVIDAFHVIQASTKALEEVRKAIQSRLTKEQALALKQDKELFNRPIEDLSADEKERLQAWEQAIPELALAVSLHQKLRCLYRCRDFEEALDLLADWEREVIAAGLDPFHKMLRTIWNWLPEIMNRFICKISNAKTEGKNNQLRAMNKQGFGYSIASLRARMQIKEDQTAVIRCRQHQDCKQKKSG